jgi:hypothetical protein
MKLAFRGVSALAFVAAVGSFASTASALPPRGVDGPEVPDTDGPTRGGGRPVITRQLDVQRDLVLPAKYRALSAAEQAAQLQGTVPEAQSNGGAEEAVDLGDLDTAEEDMPEYGVAKMALLKRPIDRIIKFPIDPGTCAGTAITDWTQIWSKSDTFGNSKFGAGYEGKITVQSQASPTPNQDKLSGEAMGRAYGTLFGLSKDLARVTLKASLTGTQGAASINVKVVGYDVYNNSAAGNLQDSKAWDKSFFSASQRIWLGPVPVKVAASANGRLGFDYKAQYAGAKVNLTANPYARAYASASASVDAVVASAGVTGSLTLLTADLPASAVLTIQPTYIDYDVDADLKLTSMSGRIDLWAKVWYLFGSKKWSTTLATWSGVSATIPVVHTQGCKPLAS